MLTLFVLNEQRILMSSEMIQSAVVINFQFNLRICFWISSEVVLRNIETRTYDTSPIC